MTESIREQELWAISKAVLADALAYCLLLPNGEALRSGCSTVLPGGIPADIWVSSFIPPRPAGDLPPEAYIRWTLWPNDPSPRPNGYINVAFRPDRAWQLTGHTHYRRIVPRAGALKLLIEHLTLPQ